jgi:hypothetical protein
MIVKRALEEPIRQIVEKVKSETAPNRGYDADSMEYVDMVQAGIIDPDQGRAGGAAERGVDRVAPAHDRGAHHGCPGREVGRPAGDAARCDMYNSASSVGAMH